MSYRIKTIVNNNLVCSLDGEGNEIILRGKGIGFQKKKGMEVEEAAVEKVYRMDTSRDTDQLSRLLADIPLPYLETCTEIIDLAEEEWNQKLGRQIYLTLTDHLSFAIQRKKQNLTYQNALLLEIKSFYPKEFAFGLKALDLVERRLAVRLPEDEAGFIALHLLNAQLGTRMDSTVEITRLISGILSIVRDYYAIQLNEDSLDYARFLTHLKFFGQRLYQNQPHQKEDPFLHDMVRERYFTDYHCAEKIRDFIRDDFHHEVSTDEMVFLTVHLRRVSSAL